jgi:hypothetical protein
MESSGIAYDKRALVIVVGMPALLSGKETGQALEKDLASGHIVDHWSDVPGA